MAWEPATGALWAAVNERDELGNDLVPDYMTAVREGGFYGWPYSYFGQHVDDARRSRSGRTWSPPRSCPTTRSGAHTASLGLAYADQTSLPARFNGGHVRRPAWIVEP